MTKDGRWLVTGDSRGGLRMWEVDPSTGVSTEPLLLDGHDHEINFIELSADGKDIYLNVYSVGEVRRISRASGEVLAIADIAYPDNLTWSKQGQLLVASQTGTGIAAQMACADLREGACPFAFEIIALDPETMKTTMIFANEGPPMGAATVALDVGGAIVIGSVLADRVIRVPIEDGFE